MAKRINWNFIKPLYCTTSLSNYEICRQYEEVHRNSKDWKLTVSEPGIRKEAKNKKWQKALAGKVKDQIKEKLVRSEVRNGVRSAHQPEQISDDEIVERVSEAGANVILRHRKEVRALLKHEDELLHELLDGPTKVHVSAYQGDVTETKLGLTVKEKAETLKSLAMVRAQRIALEREAHDLDDQADKDKGPAKIVIRRKTRDGEE